MFERRRKSSAIRTSRQGRRHVGREVRRVVEALESRVLMSSVTLTANVDHSSYSASEGGAVALSGTGSSSDGSPFSYVWDLDGDNFFGETGEWAGNGNETGQSPTYFVNGGDGAGSVIVRLKTVNASGDSSDLSYTTINISNVPPKITSFTSDGPVYEGQPLTLTLNASDFSNADQASLHYSFAMNDSSLAGSYADASPSNTGQLVFPDNGTFSVLGRIFDKDGGSDTQFLNVTINNANPTATISTSSPSNEGSPVTVSLINPVDARDDLSTLRYSIGTDPANLATSYGSALTSNSASFTFNDSGGKFIYYRIFDKDGGRTDGTTTIQIANVKPTAGISGPAAGVANLPVSYTVTASDVSSADTTAGFTYVINWGDSTSTTINASPNNTSVPVSHTYSSTGNFNISVTATDKDSGVNTPATMAVTMKPAGTGTDPFDSNRTALVVTGTANADRIDITPVTGGINVKYNGVNTVYAGVTGSIIVLGNAGNDEININDAITNNVVLFGGTGDDKLNAPSKYTTGNRILVGGDGKDSLTSGKGRDILIGGKDADNLKASDHNDILIAGRTTYDTDIASLAMIQKEWLSTTSDYQTKITHLTGTAGGDNGTTYLRANAEVFGDSVKDVLDSGGGSTSSQDLWYANTTTATKDDLRNKVTGERVIEIS